MKSCLRFVGRGRYCKHYAIAQSTLEAIESLKCVHVPSAACTEPCQYVHAHPTQFYTPQGSAHHRGSPWYRRHNAQLSLWSRHGTRCHAACMPDVALNVSLCPSVTPCHDVPCRMCNACRPLQHRNPCTKPTYMLALYPLSPLHLQLRCLWLLGTDRPWHGMAV